MRWFLYVETHLRNLSASPFIWNGLVVVAVLAIAAVLPRLGNSLFSAVERCGCRIAERRGLAIVLIAAATILLRLVLLPWVPVPVPEVHDEFSYLLAADTFTRGHLANTPHPMWLYFDTFHVNQHPSYMSIYPPAQGAVLALGQILGNPWIGVLLSSAAMCAAVVWALQGWLPPRWALLGGILLLFRLAVFSYWMNSYWGGAVAALGGALVIGALPRIMRFRRPRDGIILGLGVVILANSRPFEGLIFCLPVAGALMIWLAHNRRLLWGSFVLPFLAIVLLGASFGAYYNWRGTGDPFLPPYILNVRSHFSIPQLVWQEARPPLQFQNAQFDAYYNGFWKNIARPTGTKAIRGAWMERLQYSVGFFLWPELCLPFLALPWMLRDRRVQLLICE
jgi:hypothetical protein